MTTEVVPERHRHMWFVVRYDTTVSGRTQEVLGCRLCTAFKRRYLKVPRHGH